MPVALLVGLVLFLLLVLVFPLFLLRWFGRLCQGLWHRDASCFEEGLCLIQLRNSTDQTANVQPAVPTAACNNHDSPGGTDVTHMTTGLLTL